MKEINEFFTWVRSNNWQLELSSDKKQFPNEVLQRYINIPVEYTSFYEQITLCVNQSKTSWFLSEEDFFQTDESKFIWNEFEKISIEAAEDDEKLIQEVNEFWDLHLPIIFRVGGDYEYYAINISNGSVVYSFAPYFEEAEEVAISFYDFLDKIIKGEILI